MIMPTRTEPIWTDDLMASGSVWLRGDVDDHRRSVWPSARAPSATSGPCGVRTSATTGDICVSGVCVVTTRVVSLPSSQGLEEVFLRSAALPQVERQRGK